MAEDTAFGSLRPPAVTPVPVGVAFPPPSEGTAIAPVTPVATGAGAGAEDAFALDWCSIFIVRGTWNASTPSRRTPPTAAMIFWRLALAFGSNDFAMS